MDIQKHVSELRDEALKKRLLRIILFITIPAYILHSCITSPLYTIFDSDVALDDYSIIFDVLNDMIDLFVFFLSYAVVLYGAYRLSLKKILPTFILAMLLPIFKYLLKLVVSPLVDGVIRPDDLLMGLFSFGISGALEILQFLLIIFVSKPYIDKYRQMEAVVAKASRTVSNGNAPNLNVLPFKRMISVKNPLQRGALISAAVVSSLRLVMLAINDISKGIHAIDLGGYLIIIGGYLLELVVGVMGYMLMLYIFITLDAKERA